VTLSAAEECRIGICLCLKTSRWIGASHSAASAGSFNAFNHPNFNDKFYGITVNGPWEYASPTTPLTISKNSNWGTPADTYSGGGGFRVVQLGAKLYF